MKPPPIFLGGGTRNGKLKVVNYKMSTLTKSIVETHPLVSKEWDTTKNGDLCIEDITYGSHRSVWWRCAKGHSWRSRVYSRTGENQKNGCPVCSGRVPDETNNLKALYPDLVKGWGGRNKFGPEEVLPHSNKKVWWECPTCAFEWESAPYNRVGNGSGCPACVNQVVTSRNNLDFVYKEVSREWHPYKNKGLLPSDFVYASSKRVWWLCPVCSYSWKVAIFSRTTYKHRCPKCNKGPVSGVSQLWLESIGVSERCREHYIKDLGFRVDGFDPETNTVYEFLGDYWHGNPKKYPPKEINPTNKKSYGELYEETLKRLKCLEKAGFKVVSIWESDYIINTTQ